MLTHWCTWQCIGYYQVQNEFLNGKRVKKNVNIRFKLFILGCGITCSFYLMKLIMLTNIISLISSLLLFFSLRKLALYLQLYWPSYWLSMLSFISDSPQMLTQIWSQMKISWAAVNAWYGNDFIKAPLGTNTFWSTESTTSWILSAGIFSLQKYLFK